MRLRNQAVALALSLLPIGQTFLLGTITASTAVVVLSASSAQAKKASEIANISKRITVLIEGVQGGSGVLIKREGNRYTVLTAWHCVKDIRKGDELEINTPDGKWHQIDTGSIKRIGKVDLAVFTFSSNKSYKTASIGEIKNISMGDPIFVSGFPLASSSVPTRLLRFLKGDVIANATVDIPDGYQLLYTNPTLPGMSGGSVLNTQGKLVGIHGRSERDDEVSNKTGKAVSTGTNQAVPIAFYNLFNQNKKVVASNSKATSADDYLAKIGAILEVKGKEKEVIRLANKSLAIKETAKAYFYSAYAKTVLDNAQGAITDYTKAINIDPKSSNAYTNRGTVKSELLGDYESAILDLNKAIKIDPLNADAYNNRAFIKYQSGDNYGAIKDINKAIEINPRHKGYYINRGRGKLSLGDNQGASDDYTKAIKIDPLNDIAYHNRGISKRELGDNYGAI